MSSDKQHPYISFAQRFADPSLDYLNSYIAISRAQDLVNDLKRVRALLDADNPPEQRWAPWFGADIVSYYSVGFVTSLEWHARSRLVDLISYRPGALKTDDLKGQFGDKLLVQMIAEGAPVTHLIGASLKVSSAEKYFSVMARIFESLDIEDGIADSLTGTSTNSTVCWINPSQMQTFQHLFDFRNSLVHEIGSGVIGHPNVRESWDPAFAELVGSMVVSVMSGIEHTLTSFAPADFPNLLTEEGSPVSRVEYLEKEVLRLEQLVDREIEKTEWQSETTPTDWFRARDAARHHFEAEKSFVDKAEMLHWRYHDARTPLKMKALNYRIQFLTEFLTNFADGFVEDKPNDLP